MAIYLTEARRLAADKRLRLSWSDGRRADYDYRYLRAYCPCAVCQGHAALEVSYKDPGYEVDIESIEPVGNYGISIVFSDGHGTGIYRYDFLREIEPPQEGAAAATGERDDGEPEP